ncbi:hypothetical protein CDD82_693 [Ophiocordyceps australis]|uniref:Vacuolar import and degradation protein 21 n=1 Tax=Ophiocordyceps australis TaxID=1399860 RepID=A0A2C5YLS7_9HYPO|nr:hypothetical protein CDD82_693 [Ophiocordyceps australis]
MTEVGPSSDLSRNLQSRRNECSAIVTSRKRKLRELFAVATHVSTLPNDGFANPDAPAATAAEWQFLQASDIVQGKTLNESNIPARPNLSLDKIRQSFAEAIKVKKTLAASSESTSKNTAKSCSGTQLHEAVTVNGDGPVAAVPSVDSVKPLATIASPSVAAPKSAQNNSTEGALGNGCKPATDTDVPASQTGRDGAQKISRPRKDCETEQGVSHRPAQVKFIPGTKGSPTTVPEGLVSKANHIKLPFEKANNVDAVDARRGSNGSLSIKLPSDTSKAPEAMSTPGSTAASAATPAVLDHSTDTSPDNEGLRCVDAVEATVEKPSKSQVEKQESAKVSRPTSSSAQDELLQKAIQSSIHSPQKGITAPTTHVGTNKVHDAATAATKAHRKESFTALPSTQASLPPPWSSPRPSKTPLKNHKAESEEKQESRPNSVNRASEEHSTPVHSPPAPSPLEKSRHDQPQVSERAVTRVSSGALRRKSVNEIVGAMSRSAPCSSREVTKRSHDQLTPVTSTPQSPASRVRSIAAKRKIRVKGHAPKVLFGKQPKRHEDKALASGHKETVQASDDYYTPLFVQNFTMASKWMQPLDRMLFQANKTISSPDASLVIEDHQFCKVLRRVYHLQQHEKWSLRQPKRCAEPVRPPSHMDVLIQEMKWMRTDFREERKWKMSIARTLATACAEWVEASAEERLSLQVAAVVPRQRQASMHDDMAMDVDQEGFEGQRSSVLSPPGEGNCAQGVDIMDDLGEAISPSALFALHDDDVVFGMQRTAAADKLLNELPMYGAPLAMAAQQDARMDYGPDAHWRRPALPLSKYVEGEMRLVESARLQKRTRYVFRDEDSGDEEDEAVEGQAGMRSVLAPRASEVSLFSPDSKAIRDRLHAGHQFRPPSEFPMPLQSFFECRSSSQWTLSEDDELRGLVREYSYNWSLISTILGSKSFFSAGAERRTPWECFERWINLEGLPADMQKTQYFKAYNARIESAQRLIAQQNQQAAQQASTAGTSIAAVRRRPTIPMRVERRRNQKHLTMIDAMRKLAKKRETAVQKQQHSASQNPNKKANDNYPRGTARTPQEYSLLRWERDQALAEKVVQYTQRHEAQKRALLQAQARAQSQGGGVNVGVGSAVGRQVAQQFAASQMRRMSMQTPGNGVGLAPMGGAGVHVNGVAQAPMQPGLQPQHRMPVPNQPPDANLMLRAQRISEQQRAAVQHQHQQQQQQQQQQHHQHLPQPLPPQQQQQQQQQQQRQATPSTPGPAAAQHSPPPLRNGVNVNALGQAAFVNNAQALMASYTATTATINGHATPQTNGLHMPSPASVSSPGPRPHPQLTPVMSAQLSQIEATIRAKNPNLPPDHVRQLATSELTRALMTQRQNAMNAAAGQPGQTPLPNGMTATTSPHQYAALLRQQQQQQQLQQQRHIQQQQLVQPQQRPGQHQPQSQPQPHAAQQQQPQQQPQLQQHHQQQQQQQQRPPQQLQHQQRPVQLQHQQLQHQQQSPVVAASPTPNPPVASVSLPPATSTPTPTLTPTAAAASPALSHQRASSGSATPSNMANASN